MIAVCRIRTAVAYRREAWLSGLRLAGYTVVENARPQSSRDLFISWNLYGQNEIDAERWERDGGTVIVTENGYIGVDDQGRQPYAIAAHGHNGSGWWPCSGPDRSPGVELQPWQLDGKHILVCGQRGIGSRLMASPAGWAEKTAAKLRGMTAREIRIREHPGNGKAPKVPLADDLHDCWACVIWSSGCGVHGLAAGIPVFYDAPHWIGSPAARRFGCDVEFVMRDDIARREAFRQIGHAQWQVDEIAAGEPFIRFRSALLEAA